MKSVLITGLMGSCKTSVANRLVGGYGYPKLSMADWIKDTIARHYNVEKLEKGLSFNGKKVRTLFQEVGMYMREVDANWHIDEVFKKIIDKKIKHFTIDDIRFENEAFRIREKYDCITIKVVCKTNNRLVRIIERDLIVPTKEQLNDLSEREIDDIPYDYLINNDGTIDELIDQVDKIMRSEYENTKTSYSRRNN